MDLAAKVTTRITESGDFVATIEKATVTIQGDGTWSVYRSGAKAAPR